MQVKPGCLCHMINATGDVMTSNIGKIVTAERRLSIMETFPIIEPAWLITTDDMLETMTGPHKYGWCIEQNLKPFTDPDIDTGTETQDELPRVLRESDPVR